jgi:hypothetical protein
VLHISRDDLRELGLAMQTVADGVERGAIEPHTSPKKGLVQ